MLGNQYHLFMNTVPAEMNLKRLRLSLEELRLIAPELPLALEVHETAVTNLDVMHGIRALLAELNIKLAYDDFGAGQARLVELIEVPPDYLKFDIILIRNIHRQSSRAQQVLKSLVCMAQDLGIKTVAEGIELEEELETCISIGFDLAQGYYLGKPAPTFCTLIDPVTKPDLVEGKE
jgi:EAL domain-containing protein (putative c-di-GMP-specific phosphodiesterase class I)